MLIIDTGDNNNKTVLTRTAPERMQEIENLLFQVQDINDPEPPIMRCHPASFYNQFTQEEILNFAWKHGVYQFPTQELIDFLKGEIHPPRTIEIAAGGGHISEHLPGVIATDSKLQEEPWVKEFYKNLGQHPIKYPSKIIKMEAEDAVDNYKPDTVIGCWTVEKEMTKSGRGIDEVEIYRKVNKYIIVGNRYLHEKKSVLKMAKKLGHLKVISPPWLLSKSPLPEDNCIFIIDKLG
jgi:hypothetical protein